VPRLDRHRDQADVDVGARSGQRVLRQQLAGTDGPAQDVAGRRGARGPQVGRPAVEQADPHRGQVALAQLAAHREVAGRSPHELAAVGAGQHAGADDDAHEHEQQAEHQAGVEPARRAQPSRAGRGVIGHRASRTAGGRAAHRHRHLALPPYGGRPQN
jgi:hypothetical protein